MNRQSVGMIVCVAVLAWASELAAVENLYTESGHNPSWESLKENGSVTVGNENTQGPFYGSKIDVNNKLLESGMGNVPSITRPNRIHTHVNSRVRPESFSKWTRWYQEDGNTQIFRLFKGEQSMRSADNIKAGRIEAVKDYKLSKPGDWCEWEGTYTIIKPCSAAIFQLLTNQNPETGAGGLWAMHINMSDSGDIILTHRRRQAGTKTVTIAPDAVGKNVRVKVRYNGKDYEVYRKIQGEENDFVLVATGSYPPTHKGKGSFRWGMYQGSVPGSSIREDCMIFLTGIQIR